MVVLKSPKEIVTLNMVSDISQFNTGSNVLWSLKGKDSYRFYELNRIITDQHALTSRELEIITCLAKGMNSKETANFLKISLYTVYTHRRNMLTKMNFDNILQLVNFAFKKGLINV
jgi:DNA-binding CsgD family transcriptional regulator